MTKSKKSKMFKTSKPNYTEEPVVKPEPVVEEVPVMSKYVLTKDINLSMKKGMEVSKDKYDELVRKGFGSWFE